MDNNVLKRETINTQGPHVINPMINAQINKYLPCVRRSVNSGLLFVLPVLNSSDLSQNVINCQVNLNLIHFDSIKSIKIGMNLELMGGSALRKNLYIAHQNLIC